MKKLVFIAMLALVGVADAQPQTPPGGPTSDLWGVNDFGWVESWTRTFASGADTTVYGLTPLNVVGFGAIPDDGISDTAAISAAMDTLRSRGGGGVYFPPGVYHHDGSLLELNSNEVITGEKATIRLLADTYTATVYFFGTRTNVAYSADSTYVENVLIQGLTIDGNIDSVSTSASSNAIVAHQVRDFTVKDCIIKNMPGTTGGGYGLSFWYSSRVAAKNVRVDRTDRQNILVWETKDAVIDGCNLKDSYFRGNLLISTMSPATLQTSWANVTNTTFRNALTGGSNRAVRFSGQGSGVLENCEITGIDSTGVAVLDTFYKDVRILNSTIRGCDPAIMVSSATDKSVRIANCAIDSNTTGIRVNAGGGSIIVDNCKFRANTAFPVRLEYADEIFLTNSYIDGGTYATVRPGSTAVIRGNYFTGLSNASYAVLLGGTQDLSTYFENNILTGNTIDKVTSLQGGRMLWNILDAVSADSLNEAFHVAPSDTAGEILGNVFFDIADSTLKVWTGSAWEDLH